MFKQAADDASARDTALRNDLNDKLEHLERTATSWFDESPESVKARSSELYAAAGLCRRTAATCTYDDAEHSLLSSIASDLQDQADKLSQLHAEALMDQSRGDAPVFSSRDLSDDSGLSPVVSATDWDLFLDVEPRQFVADNIDAVSDSGEMEDRAYTFARSAVSGHGLSRKAKIEIVSAFLAEVAETSFVVTEDLKARPTARTAAKVDSPDSVMFV